MRIGHRNSRAHGLRKPLIAVAALLAGPVAAQEAVTPSEIAGFALDVCISETADVGVNVETGDFLIRGRVGDTATYVHPEGPELRLTVRPAFFGCELTLPGAEEGYLEALASALGPAMQERVGVEREMVENGMIWDIETEDGVALTARVARAEDGTVTLASTTDAAPQPPSQ